MKRYRIRRRPRARDEKYQGSKRVQFLEAVVNLDTAVPRSQLDLGIQTYISFIEHCMHEFDATLADTIPTFGESCIGDTENERLDRYFDVCSEVAQLCREIGVHSSIDSIAKQLLARYYVPIDIDAERLKGVYQLVFACIGWVTMMFSPVANPLLTEFCFTQQRRDSGNHRRVTDTANRPVGGMLRNLDVVPVHCKPQASLVTEDTSLLAVSNLNLFTLSRIGSLSVAWVDDLASHCKMDLVRKELMLFRFPSYCAYLYCSKVDTPMDCISRAHACYNGCGSFGIGRSKTYHLEVLLTYRILFGQDKRSRKLYRERIAPRAKSEGLYDSLLDVLCGHRTVSKNSMVHGHLRERSVYSSTADFQHLGQRLAQLEEYSRNQKPRGLIEVWNDHRDPYQSLTFWAVVIVGGSSIFLSVVQVILSIAQLVFQARGVS